MITESKIIDILQMFLPYGHIGGFQKTFKAIAEQIIEADRSFSDKISVVDIPDQEFHGESFQEEKDGHRLRTLQMAVESLMSDGGWRTLGQIREQLGRGSEASISARLRSAANSGRWIKERSRTNHPGLYVYRLYK